MTWKLADILNLAQKAGCKDAKDKVYGVLGFLPQELTKGLAANYNVKKQKLYLDFSQRLLEHSGLTGLLCWAHNPADASPSWISDWTVKFPRNHVQWLMRRDSARNTDLMARPWISREVGQLFCSAVVVDSVHLLSQRDESTYEEGLLCSDQHPGRLDRRSQLVGHRYGPLLQQALELTILMSHPNSRTVSVPCPEQDTKTDRALSAIYWTEDCSTNIRGSHRSCAVSEAMQSVTDNPLWEYFDSFRKSNQRLDIFGTPFRDFFLSESDIARRNLDGHDVANMRLAVLALEGRRLVTTSTGYLGLVPEQSRKGDLIAVLRGCNFPVVVRPLKCDLEMVRMSCRRYRYIGECYVHGLMNGEAIGGKDAGKLSEAMIALV